MHFGCCDQQADILCWKDDPVREAVCRFHHQKMDIYFLSVFTFTHNYFHLKNLPYIPTQQIIQNVMLSCEALVFLDCK